MVFLQLVEDLGVICWKSRTRRHDGPGRRHSQATHGRRLEIGNLAEMTHEAIAEYLACIQAEVCASTYNARICVLRDTTHVEVKKIELMSTYNVIVHSTIARVRGVSAEAVEALVDTNADRFTASLGRIEACVRPDAAFDAIVAVDEFAFVDPKLA